MATSYSVAASVVLFPRCRQAWFGREMRGSSRANRQVFQVSVGKRRWVARYSQMLEQFRRIGVATDRVLSEPSDRIIGLGDHLFDRIANNGEQAIGRTDSAAIDVFTELHVAVNEEALMERRCPRNPSKNRNQFVVRHQSLTSSISEAAGTGEQD